MRVIATRAAILSAALLIAGLPVRSTGSPVDPTAMNEVLGRLVERNEGFGGGVCSIRNASGIVWDGTAGLTAGPGSAPMRADTPFEIASITKAVTAATILRLVENGRFGLETRLSDLLPQRECRGFDGAITVRQLLSHTSGLRHYWTDGPRVSGGNNAFLTAFLAEPGRFWEPQDILDSARSIPAKRPGSAFHYSDTNYVLLGRIIENVTGQPLHRVFRTMIFDRLGMNDTWLTYRENRRGEKPSHRFEGSEDLDNVRRQSADWAGGGLVSTTADLNRFLRGLAHGGLFRDPGTLKVMLQGVPTGDTDISYGLGLYRIRLSDGKGELWGHDGHGNSFAYYWPEQDLTFTGTLNQTENDWWPLVESAIEGRVSAMGTGADGRTFSASLSTGWDSLYMSRGVNGLRTGTDYGSGIAWTNVNLTWNITENDAVSVGVWQAFATQGSSYKETDVSIGYVRSVGDFEIGVGYEFDYGTQDGSFYSNELNASVSTDISVGPVTVTPSVNYNFNLGPDSDTGQGFNAAGSSFLNFRVDGSLPVYREIVALEAWGAFGVNFDYNTTPGSDGEDDPFVGANNIEFGISIPIQVTEMITVSGYAAYSRALTELTGTADDTFWGGVAVTFSY